MKKSTETLLEKYQVRKTKKQKQEFAAWLKSHCSAHGYTLREEQYSESGNNLIVGDVQSAELILAAHYDTPPNFGLPVMMGFSNWIFFSISQIIMLVPMLLLYAVSFFFVLPFFGPGFFSAIPLLLMVVYAAQMMFGIANKHNANDNTSGVATLVSILEELPEEERKKVCIVFFDQEELGLVGSKKFYNKYQEIVKHKPLINFDCVSDGSTLTFVVKKKFQNSKYFELLQKASDESVKESKKINRFASAFWNIYPSDQLHFPCGVGVVAAKKAPLLGYYIDRLHSACDTRFDNENIGLLTDTMLQFIRTV